MDTWKEIVEKLRGVDYDMYGKDYLRTWDLSKEQLLAVMYVAQCLEWFQANNYSCKVFDSQLAVSNFRDKSTRTRFSFASAASLLGLTVSDMDESKSQISHGETTRETANMISFLTETIGIRDDLFIHEGHAYQKEVAESVEEGYKEKVLPQRPTVVNLQCDEDHPTQSMSDMMHLVEHFGGVENLKGKKIAVSWAYSPSYGKPLSVAQGLIGLLPRFGMDVVLAYPEGYDVLPEILETSKTLAKEGGGKLEVVHDMDEAFKDALVVYPKSWAPFTVMEKRVELLRKGQAGKKEMDDLEKFCVDMNKKNMNWECTEEKMKLTKDGKALYMHCLPAEISGLNFEHGEVEKSVFERYRLATYKEAKHKPFVIAAAILLGRFKNAEEVLQKIGEGKTGHIRKEL